MIVEISLGLQALSHINLQLMTWVKILRVNTAAKLEKPVTASESIQCHHVTTQSHELWTEAEVLTKPESRSAHMRQFLAFLTKEYGEKEYEFPKLKIHYAEFCWMNDLEELAANIWPNELKKLGITRELRRCNALGQKRQRKMYYKVFNKLITPEVRVTKKKSGVRITAASARRTLPRSHRKAPVAGPSSPTTRGYQEATVANGEAINV